MSNPGSGTPSRPPFDQAGVILVCHADEWMYEVELIREAAAALQGGLLPEAMSTQLVYRMWDLGASGATDAAIELAQSILHFKQEGNG